ncbi:MAG: CPBP family glutamic-type intramembrane protease [Gammaproteobacteria bacterium]|nr:CPBP family glutamic-type intramembrane protease [Gammaproteobacteria bacterium]
MSLSTRKHFIAVLWLIGMVGVFSLIPFTQKLILSQGQELPMPMIAIQFISVIQGGVLLLIAVLLGTFFAYRVHLSAPLIEAILKKGSISGVIKKQISPAITGGIAGGVFLLLFTAFFHDRLPSEFISAAENFSPPWYTRIFYGGITEEILMRWGAMSFLAWISYRLFQGGKDQISSGHYIFAILASALLFGVAHLPAVHALSPVIDMPLIVYIIIGNSTFGFIAGVLFWRFGLECAIIAHMAAHVVMLIGNMFV